MKRTFIGLLVGLGIGLLVGFGVAFIGSLLALLIFAMGLGNENPLPYLAAFITLFGIVGAIIGYFRGFE